MTLTKHELDLYMKNVFYFFKNKNRFDVCSLIVEVNCIPYPSIMYCKRLNIWK